jgi:hypothetical protein
LPADWLGVDRLEPYELQATATNYARRRTVAAWLTSGDPVRAQQARW